ncbi:sulfite exporter TauE/SafE family protein [Pseudoruegeria sp. SK021]|uniref:sulfite exporter TauE/SafE family protein n=1 Tax=Pseudoruegeria sp. SK021 TaxID=1933035 RepID=UPI000A22D2E0|nr:sulfite exporter TauE/SafE family protein [Pseudoruegeria sp. SK021]OSP53559.1 hypothetical protein BV911_17305 [Pseudoruegeria sp. SK021]
MDTLYSPQLLGLLSIGLLCTGAIAGVLAGLLGVGGGIVIVPVLFLLFHAINIPEHLVMYLAVATSLATIIPTSIASARAHHKRGTIDVALLRSWAPWIVLGAAVGGLLSKVLDSSSLTLIFGCIALAVSINMALPRKIILSDHLPSGQPVIAGGIGLFSALMGIGGGTLTVPVLTAVSFPIHRAVGTAAAFGLLIAVPAVVGFVWSGWGVAGRPPFSLGYVSIPAAVLIFSTSTFTAPIGARIAASLDPARLRIAFAVFLFLSSVKMLWSVLG